MTDPVQVYSCFVFETVTGRIVDELQLQAQPTWLQQVNNTGSWQVQTLVGDLGNPPRDALRNYAISGARYSVAVCWGNFICQAGPVVTPAFDDATSILTLSGGGLWNLYNRRLLVNHLWNPSTTAITDVSADLNFTGQLWDIAALLIYEGTRNDTFRGQTTLPADIPSVSGTGSNTRFYPGYDCVSVGQRLQELTQVDSGPDVNFVPYFSSTPGYIRWGAFTGTPYLQQPGSPVVWDWGSNLQLLPVTGDASNQATAALVRGSGNERTLLTAYASDSTMTAAGWPSSDYIDSSHSSATDQASLNGYAAADVTLYKQQIQTWTPIVRADIYPQLGTYGAGTFGQYNIRDHPLLADGLQSVRIIGLANGSQPGEVKHILAAQGVS